MSGIAALGAPRGIGTSAHPLRPRWRALVLGFSVLGSSLLATLVFAEWSSARPILLEQSGEDGSGHRFQHHPRYGWSNVAGQRGATYGKRLTINQRGLRDRDYAVAKPKGTRRILVLGDSFTWGYGVRDDEVFTEVLEARLAAERRPWEVINAGVNGYGTDQEYLWLREEGFAYEPDLVVVAFFSVNDYANNVSRRSYGLNKPVFDADLRLRNVPVPPPGAPCSSEPIAVDPLQHTVRILERLAADCAEREIPVLVMQFGGFAAGELRRRGRAEAARLLAKRTVALERALDAVSNVAYYDLDATFRERGLGFEQLVAGNHDGHWNASGHAVVGAALHQALDARGLLDR